MKKIQALAAFILVAAGMSTALAQMTPVGVWRSIDEKEGTPKAEVRITEANGDTFEHTVQTAYIETVPTASAR